MRAGAWDSDMTQVKMFIRCQLMHRVSYVVWGMFYYIKTAKLGSYMVQGEMFIRYELVHGVVI